jgi:iron complex outermembrane recepter protein
VVFFFIKGTEMKKTLFLTLVLMSSLAVAQDGPELEQIVVTATKRETQLKDTPISMSVESAEDLEERHVQSLLDLGDGSVPGLNVATFEARQTALTIGIRGIVPLDANQPAREQGVGVYIDGVYLGRQHGLNAALLDIERIEVLKGPQGTLFGRNTSGGALSIVTKKPTGFLEGTVKAGAGNYGSNNIEAHINLPEVANISTKIDFISQYQDATIENPLEGQAGWNFFDRTGARFSADWQGDYTNIYFTADVGTDNNTPFYSQLLNFDPNNKGLDPLPSMIVVEGNDRMKVADIGVPQAESGNETSGVSLTVTRETNLGFEFKSITAVRDVSSEQWDNSGGAHRVPEPKPNRVFSRYSLSKLGQDQVSQEFQIVGSTNTIDYVAGVYYFKENAWEEAATPSTNQWNADLTGYTTLDPATWAYENWSVDRGSRATSESTGVFGQVTYTNENLPTVHFTVGGRQTQDDKVGRLYKVKGLDAEWDMNLSTSRFNPLAIVAWDASEDVNVYAKYATGYRSGGASSRSLSFNEFGPEDVDSYELGFKYEGNAARLNLSAYTMDRTGSQIDFSQVNFDPITQSTRNTLETLNAPGVTKINGLEVDGQIAITDELQLRAAYTYTSTDVPDTVNPFNGELQPVFIVFTPENVFNVGADYTKYFKKFVLNGHFDVSKTDAANAFSEYALKNDAHTIANASLAIEDIQIGNGSGWVQLWARNLTDEAYVYRRDPQKDDKLGTYGNFNAPRTYGLTVGYKF